MLSAGKTSKTYSRKGSTLLSPPTISKASSVSSDQPSTIIKDANELVGMGAINMLADDIQFLLDNLNPKRPLPIVLNGFVLLIRRIKGCDEFGRQFRAHNGLSAVFEWWSDSDNDAIQNHLLWLFCHLGYKLRRVDHFAEMEWIFKLAHRVFEGNATEFEFVKSTDAFSNYSNILTVDTIGKYLIGKAVLCNTKDSKFIDGLADVCQYLSSRDEQTLILLDVAVSCGIEKAKEQIIDLLSDSPYSLAELKALVSVSGSENGWTFIKDELIKHLLYLDYSNEETAICSLSILINCADRVCSQCIVANRSKIAEIEDSLSARPRLYASLLLAFCLKSDSLNTSPPNVNQAKGIKVAINEFALIPDINGANSIRSLSDWFHENGWLNSVTRNG